MPTELIKDFIDKECKITFINEQFEVFGKIQGQKHIGLKFKKKIQCELLMAQWLEI